MSWWRQQCPARGAGLTHCHWNMCKPEDVHPAGATEANAGRPHAANQCCECEQFEAEAQAPEVTVANVTETKQIPPPPPLDIPGQLEAQGIMPITPPPFASETDFVDLLAYVGSPRHEREMPSKGRTRVNRLRFLKWLYQAHPERLR